MPTFVAPQNLRLMRVLFVYGSILPLVTGPGEFLVVMFTQEFNLSESCRKCYLSFHREMLLRF